MNSTQRAASNALLAEYGRTLDERRYDQWLALFDDPAAYVLQPRENFDRQLPLATLRLESREMIADRIFGIENTLFHQPYYQRHIIGQATDLDSAPTVPGRVEKKRMPADAWLAQANYSVFRTRPGEGTTVFNVGRYLMILRESEHGTRLCQLSAVFDTELIPNSVIYPL